FGLADGLGVLYWSGVMICGALLWIEHRLVGDGDLNHIHTAFFTINGWLGILLLIFSYLEIFR
ncbi:MAG TPA: 4-hydroxybenzoate octaprenyltransferase, partial [Candidatus Eisenbacteria bacterium]|nr:4-hydroxybenzoate octaprenyltransferase [Candidatus Eisenbacteria bacterium]